jgi:ABC-type branched-chain amino acid transport system, permease component
LSGYELTVMQLVLIYIIMAVSLQVTLGFAGQISIASGAFAATGAYTTALLTTRAEWPMLLVLLASIVVAGVAGLLIGMPSLRVREDFLAIVTLGFAIIVASLASRWQFVGGALGIPNLPLPSIGSFVLDQQGYTLFVFLITVLVVAAVIGLSRSRLGLRWRSVRDDELAASTMGMSVGSLKLSAFAIGAAFTGLAGALFAYSLGFVGADSFKLDFSIMILAMVVIGGLGSLTGAVIGAVALALLPEILRSLADYRLTIFGLILVVVLIALPGGLVGSRGYGRSGLSIVKHLLTRGGKSGLPTRRK